MHIKSFIPASLHAELETVFQECNKSYFYFDPNDLLHQMFAMQIVLARRADKQVVQEAVVERDDAMLVDMLELVGINVSVEWIEQWTDEQYNQADMWAWATAASAADQNVFVPKMPKFLEKFNHNF